MDWMCFNSGNSVYMDEWKKRQQPHIFSVMYTNLQRACCYRWLRWGRADWHMDLDRARSPISPHSARLSPHNGSSYFGVAARYRSASVSPGSPGSRPGLSGPSLRRLRVLALPGLSPVLCLAAHLARSVALLGLQRKRMNLEPEAKGEQALWLLGGAPRSCHPVTGGCSSESAPRPRHARGRRWSVCQRYP